MINYFLSMAVNSRSQGNNGKCAWRAWYASRFFKNHELPRLPTVGSKIRLGGWFLMVCTSADDSIGYYGPDSRDETLPLTTFFFEPDKSWCNLVLDTLLCYQGQPYWVLETDFNKAGFSVQISKPLRDQQPQQITPSPSE